MLNDFHGSTAPTTASIEYLLAYLVHNRNVLLAALAKLNPNQFLYENERIYAAFVDTLFSYVRSSGEVPSKSILECDYISRLEKSPSFNEVDVRNACDLIEWIFEKVSVPELQTSTDHGLKLLQIFLLDRIRKDLHEAVSDNLAATANVELPAIVSEIERKLSEVSLISDIPDGVIDPSKWIEEDREPFLTGIPFIDSYTITYPSDVNVILGVTGVGKTTLAIQILTYAARREYYHSKDRGWMAYFGYEDLSSSASKRIISCAAKIRRDRLENIRSIDDLSTKNNLQQYEREYYMQNSCIERLGERERYFRAMEFIKDTIRVYNCSGVRIGNEKPLGNGGIEEVKFILEATQQKLGRPLKLVVIDWAGMLVRRYLQSKGKFNDKNIILALESFIDQVYQQISLPFNCVVFVVHQLKGSVSKQSPVSSVSHADAAWCSNFAVNAWNVICFGPKDPDTGAFTLSWTKTRRGKGKKNLVCRIDDNFCQIVADDSYYLDQITRRILKAPKGSIYGEEKTTFEEEEKVRFEIST